MTNTSKDDALPAADLLTRLEVYAAQHRIPILKTDGLAFLRQMIRLKQVKTVLEIGTAIGYSAIAMVLQTEVSVVSVERDQAMFERAKKTIDEAKLSERIRLIFADALTMDVSSLGSFDLLFIDAAKGQNLPIFQKFESCVPSGGLILIDNLGFHGFVANPETILSRDRRQMIHKIQQFNEYILHNGRFDAAIYDIGDGIGLCLKK
jgi:predicted O-methyltransferase YrrM